MKIVKQWIKVEPYDGIEIEKRIERACRVCYRSNDYISQDSYKQLITNCIKSGHESVIEHEKISVYFYGDVGSYKDLTRHRTGTSFSVESTRYCNYSSDKFENDIHFIDPVFIENKENYDFCIEGYKFAEEFYMKMANNGAKPDELRMLLPHGTAAEYVLTANIREWRHILRLRTSKKVHPSIRQLLIPLLLKFKQDMPELFGDIPYDEDFPTEWYAEIKEY